MAGNPKPIANPRNIALAKPPLAHQLVQFKLSCKCFATTVLDNSSALLFKPENKFASQFIGLAIQGIHAAVSCNVSISMDTQHALATQLVSLSRRCSATVLRNFLDLVISLIPVSLDFKGKVSWDDALPIKCDLKRLKQSEPTYAHVLIDELQQQEVSSANHMHIMVCPSCKQPNVAQSHKLQQANLEIRIKCSNCCMRPTAFEWLCNCGIMWHTML